MRPTNHWRQLVGRPYCQDGSHPNPPETFDCFTLVKYVRELCYQITTPLMIGECFLRQAVDRHTNEIVDIDQMAKLIEIHLEHRIYKPVAEPKPGDIVMFNDHHIGVVVEGGVLAAFKVIAHDGAVYFFNWRKMHRFYSSAVVVR